MHPPLLGAIVVLLGSAPSTAAPSALAVPLECVETEDGQFIQRKGRLLLGWSSVRLRRIADLDVFVDGRVTVRVDYRDAGRIECKSRLTAERLAALRNDIARTNAWRLKLAHDRDAEWEALAIYLDQHRRGSAALTPREWATFRSTRALQRVIDQLKLDVCGGVCPEPKNRTPSYDLDPWLRRRPTGGSATDSTSPPGRGPSPAPARSASPDSSAGR